MSPEAPITTLALVDTRWVGHHPTYFREFAASLQRLGVFVIALCPEPSELAPSQQMWAAPLAAPNASLLPGSEHDPVTTVARWWAARQALGRAEAATGRPVDAVFFPYLDAYLRGLPSSAVPEIVLGRPWSGLYFRPQHLLGDRSSTGRLRTWAKGDCGLRSRTLLPCLGVLDERCLDPVAQWSGRRVLAFPDITDESPPALKCPLADAVRSRANGRPIIGLAGSLEKRKGLLTWLRTAEACAAAGDPWFFAAVGTFADETFTADERTWIAAASHRLADSVFIDESRQRIADGPEYNAVVSTFSVAWAAYEAFQGSSNTLTKAAMLRKPVVATAHECIGERVEAYALGATIPEGDHAAARSAIARLLNAEHAGSIVRGYADYYRQHARPQLDHTFRQLLAHLPLRPA